MSIPESVIDYSKWTVAKFAKGATLIIAILSYFYPTLSGNAVNTFRKNRDRQIVFEYKEEYL